MQNLELHYNIEYPWDRRNNHAKKFRQQMRNKGISSTKQDKVKDVLDIIPEYSSTATPPSWDIQWEYVGENEDKKTIEYKIPTRKIELTISSSIGSHDNDVREHITKMMYTRGARVSNRQLVTQGNAKVDKVFIELDTSRAQVGMFDTSKSKIYMKDMYVTARTGLKETKTKKVIFADMPETSLTRRPLLFEPFSKGSTDDMKGKVMTDQCVQGDMSPVVNKMYYHSMVTVIRNMWMVYALNTMAAQVPTTNTHPEKWLIVIGAKHATKQFQDTWDSFLFDYSMRKMLIDDKVLLPFTFVRDGPQKPMRIKLNMDPAAKPKSNAREPYANVAAAVMEYDDWMEEEFEYYFDEIENDN